MNSTANISESRIEGLPVASESDFESPFLDRYEPISTEEPGKGASLASSVWQQLESPFLSNLEMESVEGENPQAQLYTQLLAELHDEEFNEVISDLVQEVSVKYEDQISYEVGGPASQHAAAQEAVREHLEPLIHETEELLETISQALPEQNSLSMSEEQLEEWFEQFEPNRSDLSPAFENFLKGVWKKVKKVAKGAARVAKKGLKTIATGGLNIILGKLKKLVRPLLARVLQTAIGKLPTSLRPAARLLAKRFLGVGETEAAYEEELSETAGPETEDIQREFDVQVTNALIGEDGEESEAALAEYQVFPEEVGENEFEALQDARARFVDRVTQLQEGEDVRPAMEEFIPAILPALKIGIRLIGRQRVVNFLAGLLAKFITRFVGRDMARSLSRAIVDTGLRLATLETTEEFETRTAGNAIAATVEETVQQVAALPESVYEDFELLETYALEAFEQAAAANFPAEIIRPELREASVNGAWVLMPVKHKRKFYKKYTRVFDKVISSQTASKIMTFGGRSLMTALRDQLNLDPTKGIRARVHIYETILSTWWLSRISSMERNVPGLGSPAEIAWSQFHPLTPEAAAALLGEPGLGRTVPDRFLQDRRVIKMGQRFYYLEIEGARPVIHPRHRVRHSSRVHVKVDCPGNRIYVAIYLSEREAQKISSKLRQNIPWSTIARDFTALLHVIQGNIAQNSNVKIVHEAVALENYAGVLPPEIKRVSNIVNRVIGAGRQAGNIATDALRRISGVAGNVLQKIPDALSSVMTEKVIEWCLRKLSEYFREKKQEFIKATENPADGVTILITFANPEIVPIICRTLRGKPVSLTPSIIPRTIPCAQIRVLPGLQRV
jgi:hypothetical protein